MVAIGVELEFGGRLRDAPAKGAGTQAAEDLISALTAWWGAHVLDTYLALPSAERRGPVDVTLPLLGKPSTFTVRFDENHLADAVEAYTAYGWAAVDAVEREVVASGGVVVPTLVLVSATRNVLAVLVADSMRRIEVAAKAFAQTRWTAGRRETDKWLDRFRVIPFMGSKGSIKDLRLAWTLVNQCHDYAVSHREASRLQEKIDERNRIVPPSRRRPGSGADLWFELYAAPQRELLERMGTQAALITRTFPPAALVLTAPPKELLDVHDPRAQEVALGAMNQAIYQPLVTLRSELDSLLATLRKPDVTVELATLVDPVRAGNFRRLVPGYSGPLGDPARRVLDAVLDRDDGEQRVLADLDLLVELRDGDAAPTAGLDAVVLFRYVDMLVAEVERRRASEKAWATFWSMLEWVGAALGLIALLATFPFGGEVAAPAAAPALLTVLGLAGAASALIGVVVLLLHQITGSMEKAGQLDRAVRDRLYRLGQDDPDALRELGQALARSRELREAALTGALASVVTLGAAHKIKLIGAALTFTGFVDDMETVFRPLAPSGGVGP